MKFSMVFGAILLGQRAVAHPGQSAEENAKEVAERRAYLANNRRSLDHCTDTLKVRGNDYAMHVSRSAAAEKLRAKRAILQEKPYLQVRDLDTVLATSHESNLTGITVDSDPSILFSGNNSCILTPEVTQGPYWVQGELIREDVTESGEGVPLTLHIQIIDVNTCEPVPQAFLEIWHCNSTGVYSGVVANGNGNSNDSTNLDTTFLRGIQQSDDDGVVTFETLFPGHYTGRATHIHVMSALNATVNANETISGGSVTHVGQMFFDQDLITLVETQEPYNSNTQNLTKNTDDSILAEEAGTVDPFVEYVLLGDDVSEGVFGWLSFGMDIKNTYNITPAAFLTENGGVENENAGGGMGGGAGGPPSGSPPSGAILSGNATIATDTNVSSNLSTSVILAVSSSAAGETAPTSGARPLGVRPSGVRPSGAVPSSSSQGRKGHFFKGHSQQAQPSVSVQAKEQLPQAQQHQQQQGPPQA